MFCPHIKQLHSLRCYHVFSNFNLPEDRLGYHLHLLVCKAFATTVLSPSPPYLESSSNNTDLNYSCTPHPPPLNTEDTPYLWVFFVYKTSFWFTLIGKSSARKGLRNISSINNLFDYPTTTMHSKGNYSFWLPCCFIVLQVLFFPFATRFSSPP